MERTFTFHYTNVSEFVDSTSFAWIRPKASAPNIRTDLVLNLTLTVPLPPMGLHPYPAPAPSWTAASSPASTAYPREITPRIVLFVFSLNCSCSSVVADLRGAGRGFVYENLIRCSARCSVRMQPNAQILLPDCVAHHAQAPRRGCESEFGRILVQPVSYHPDCVLVQYPLSPG